MDLHEPPALGCYYVADCPSDIIPTLYTAGAKHKKSTFTDKVRCCFLFAGLTVTVWLYAVFVAAGMAN